MNSSKRQEVLERDGFECQFCEMTNEKHEEKYGRGIEVHHVVPKKADGSDDKENLLTVCKSCHSTLERTQGNLLKRLYENELQDKIQEKNKRIEELEDQLVDRYSFDEIIEASDGMTETVDVYVGLFRNFFKSNPNAFVTCDKDNLFEEMDEYPFGDIKMSNVRVPICEVVKNNESDLAKRIDRKKRRGVL